MDFPHYSDQENANAPKENVYAQIRKDLIKIIRINKSLFMLFKKNLCLIIYFLVFFWKNSSIFLWHLSGSSSSLYFHITRKNKIRLICINNFSSLNFIPPKSKNSLSREKKYKAHKVKKIFDNSIFSNPKTQIF